MHKKGHCHSSGVIRAHHHQGQEIGTSAFRAADPTVARAQCPAAARWPCINIALIAPKQRYKQLFYHSSSHLLFTLSLLGLGGQN